MSTTVWYRPELSTVPAECFCGAKSRGFTTYFNGVDRTVRFQCKEHLPVSGRALTWTRRAVKA